MLWTEAGLYQCEFKVSVIMASGPAVNAIKTFLPVRLWIKDLLVRIKLLVVSRLLL